MSNKKHSGLKISIFLGTTIALIGIIVYTINPQIQQIQINQITNSTGDINLSLTPSSLNTKLNSDSSVSLMAKTGDAKLIVLATELSYDPSKIKVLSITQGSFLSNVIASPKIESGKIIFTYAASPASGGAQGTGEIAKIKFNPIVTGKSTISIAAKTLATATKNGERIPSNSLLSATDTTIITEAKESARSRTATTPSDANESPTLVTTESASDATNITIPGTLEKSKTKMPNIFQKVAIGWSIIFQYISDQLAN